MVENVRFFGIHEEGAIAQINSCASDEHAAYAVLAADGHQGYNCPIGGVIAYKNAVSPASVGFDIACGNKAVKLNVAYNDIKDNLNKIADEIFSNLSFGVGLNNSQKVDSPVFENEAWKNVDFLRHEQSLFALAREQLGTIGSGNHFVDVFTDKLEQIWIGVHFGSRGLGHKIATHFIKEAGGNPNSNPMDKPVVIDTETELGNQYIEAMNLAGAYAYAGRDWVCSRVAEIIGAEIVQEVHNHHNFAWKESHFGEEFWVVRKGSTPVFPGQQSFIGSSMGGNSVIVEGVDSDVSKDALYSTVHGAGRVMSRTQAAGKSKWVNGKKVRVSEGLVNMDQVRQRLTEQNIILRGAGADEAPEVYKNLEEVLGYHAGTIQVLHTLKPLIVCMAGDEYDPYKD
jgi:tRNA-splicing ligase RtcB (3'-phosphate/5'-hydroxy nucleic acid ligase)